MGSQPSTAARNAEPKNSRSEAETASQIFEKGAPSRAEQARLPEATRRVNAGAFINNFIPEAGIQRIADTLIGWKEEEKLGRIVDLDTAPRDRALGDPEGKPQVASAARDNLKKNDYNISPSRYIHTGDAETTLQQAA
jgi:hypothetical protein